jgi:hypothetical protein
MGNLTAEEKMPCVRRSGCLHPQLCEKEQRCTHGASDGCPEEAPSSNLRLALEQFLREQSERISPTPRAGPGSYYRGYDNGMSDILRGLQALLARSGDETPTAQCGCPLVPIHDARTCLSVKTSDDGSPGAVLGCKCVMCEFHRSAEAIERQRRADTRPARTTCSHPPDAQDLTFCRICGATL